jgi:hypothetical protein
MGTIYLVKMSFMWNPDFLRLIRSFVSCSAAHGMYKCTIFESRLIVLENVL